MSRFLGSRGSETSAVSSADSNLSPSRDLSLRFLRNRSLNITLLDAHRPRFRVDVSSLLQRLRKLNLFESPLPTTDQHLLKNQLISTRLFIFLLALSLTILLTYISTVTIDQTITLKQPSQLQYQQIADQHSQTLTCPCTQISIENSVFLRNNYTLHQVCSSNFVSDAWFKYLQLARDQYKGINTDDFRMNSPFTFRTLRSLCAQVQTTITNSLHSFYGNQYVTSSLVSSIVLNTQLESIITQFRVSMIHEFLSSSRLVQDTIQVNGLLSSTQSNANLSLSPQHDHIIIRSRIYGSCSCANNALCKTKVDVHDNSRDIVLFSVPGMFTGCYVLQSLLQSTLECFYDQICFDHLRTALSQNISSNATIFNASVSSVYSENTTMGEILNELMIEVWNWTVLYDKYYEACQPSECRYTVKTRNAAIYIVTTLIGLVGGLVTALKIAAPVLVKLARRKKTRTAPPTGNTKWQLTASRIVCGFGR